jgi:hypothetical protein
MLIPLVGDENLKRTDRVIDCDLIRSGLAWTSVGPAFHSPCLLCSYKYAVMDGSLLFISFLRLTLSVVVNDSMETRFYTTPLATVSMLFSSHCINAALICVAWLGVARISFEPIMWIQSDLVLPSDPD